MEAFLVSTGVVALGEMGDKTQLLAFLLAAKFKRPLPIVLGILAATVFNHTAAGALGLRSGMVLRKVILPQALRVIVPPMTSQYLNLTKNSSLAVAIGYQDIVSIANTTLNQTGQAIEGIAVIMAVYLTISLSISLFMNWYNARIALVER